MRLFNLRLRSVEQARLAEMISKQLRTDPLLLVRVIALVIDRHG